MTDDWNEEPSSNGGFGGGFGEGFGGTKSGGGAFGEDSGGSGFGSSNGSFGGDGESGGSNEFGGRGRWRGRGRGRGRGGRGRGAGDGFRSDSGGFGGGFGSSDNNEGESAGSGFGSSNGGFGGGGFGSSDGGFSGSGFGGFNSNEDSSSGFERSDTNGDSDIFGSRGRGRGRGRGGRGRGRGRGGGFGGGDNDTGGGGGGFGGDYGGDGEEKTFDPNRPAPVTYVPPEPSEVEEEMFRSIAKGINFDNYDNIPVEVTGPGNIPTAIRDFSESTLSEQILENIKKAKYSKPTPVQKYAVPIVLGNRDLMACAQTGSGKTAAFLLPVLNGIMEHREEFTSQLSEVQAPLGLVIAPTRELANQIFQEARKFSRNTSIRPVVVYGGVSVAHQLRQVEAGCNLLVGTPGRLKDFINRGKISLENLKYLILDEADRMLDMGFMPEVKHIVGEFNMPSKEERRTLMFSATFPEQIQKLASEFLNEYVFVTIGKIGSTHSDIEQSVLEIDGSSKRDKLVEILNAEGGNRNLVFVQTKRMADFLASYLCQNGFPTTSIHGDRYQQQREEALREFKSGHQTVLIATAVAARGLDIADVKQVINFDLPDEIEEYIHRIGRTGRIGNKGKAVSFFSRGKDEGLARALVKTLADAEQEVPDWLEEVAETALGTGYGPKGGRFASKDTRDGGSRGGGGGRFNAVGNDDGWGDPRSTDNGGGDMNGGGEEECWD